MIIFTHKSYIVLLKSISLPKMETWLFFFDGFPKADGSQHLMIDLWSLPPPPKDHPLHHLTMGVTQSQPLVVIHIWNVNQQWIMNLTITFSGNSGKLIPSALSRTARETWIVSQCINVTRRFVLTCLPELSVNVKMGEGDLCLPVAGLRYTLPHQMKVTIGGYLKFL